MAVSDTRVDRWFLFAWLLLSLWLLACAFMIQGEYGDGYQTIVNARHFFADSPDYYVQRGPLAAVALWPAEIMVQLFGIDPFDVRPYHLLSAFLHSAYLFGCWVFLKRSAASAKVRLLAFAAAILSVLFYAYAPYLSHDLLPGLLFLLQIFICERWLRHSRAGDAVILVVLGAAVTLIKQTYAVFWLALVVYAAIALLLKWDNERVTTRKFLGLVALGGGSAILSWLVYALFIEARLPHAPLLSRPLSLIAAVSTQYDGDLSTLFSRDIYLRNLQNYGTAAILLIAPGLVLALRGPDARLRQVAVCWLVSALAVCMIDFREVRYLAFLAPLTALLIVPAIQKLQPYRVAMLALLMLVLVDQTRGLTVAVQQLSSTARINVTRFINATQGEGTAHVSQVLSFVYDASGVFNRDRYHGIYHLTPELMHRLSEGKLRVKAIPDARELGLQAVKTGDRVYYSNSTMVRRPPWNDENLPLGLAEFLMVAGDVVDVELVLRNGRYERDPVRDEFLVIVPDPSAGQQMSVTSTGSISVADASRLFGGIEGRERLLVKAVVVKALCQVDQCIYR